MKKTVTAVLAIVFVVALGVGVFAAGTHAGGNRGKQLTAEEKTEYQTKKADVLAKYNALPDDQKALFKEMLQVLTPADLLTDAEKADQKAKMEADKAERQAKLDEEYNALTADEKALVDEIRAAYPTTFSETMTDADKQSQKAKQEAVMVKIKALSDTEKTKLKDFLPMGMGRGGRGPMGSPGDQQIPPDGEAPAAAATGSNS